MLTARIVGRQHELSATAELFQAGRLGPAGLVLHGDVGIGKTTLWQAAVRQAEEGGMSISWPVDPPRRERSHFRRIGRPDVRGQRRGRGRTANAAAPRAGSSASTSRSAGARAAPAEGSIATAFLTVLRRLAAHTALLIAVDDLQWLDRASWRVLEFGLRRLKTERVAFLGAWRTEPDRRWAEVSQACCPARGCASFNWDR